MLWCHFPGAHTEAPGFPGRVGGSLSRLSSDSQSAPRASPPRRPLRGRPREHAYIHERAHARTPTSEPLCSHHEPSPQLRRRTLFAGVQTLAEVAHTLSALLASVPDPPQSGSVLTLQPHLPCKPRALPDIRPLGARPSLAAGSCAPRPRSLSSPPASLAVLPSLSRPDVLLVLQCPGRQGPEPSPCAPPVRVHLLPERSQPGSGPRYPCARPAPRSRPRCALFPRRLPDEDSAGISDKEPPPPGPSTSFPMRIPWLSRQGPFLALRMRTTPCPPTAFPIRSARRPGHHCASITLCCGACIPVWPRVPTPRPPLPPGGCVLAFWAGPLPPSLPDSSQERRDPASALRAVSRAAPGPHCRLCHPRAVRAQFLWQVSASQAGPRGLVLVRTD